MSMLQPGQEILDIGCGFGRISRVMAEKGCNVIGIDINEQELAQAKAMGGNSIDYRHMSGTDMSEI